MKRAQLLFLLLLAVLVPLEWVAARCALETLGELEATLLALAVSLNVPLAVLAWWRPALAGTLAFVLATLIIPYQLILGTRLLRVQREVMHIITYTYEEKQRTGFYPENLKDYPFRDLGVSPYIQSYITGPQVRGGFQVTFCVGTPTTSHWYSSEGGWGYNTD